MRERILSDPQFQLIAPRAFKAVRRGDFKTTFDMIYGDLELNRCEYEALGITLLNILHAKRGSDKFSHIYRLSGFMARAFGLRGRVSDDLKRVALATDLESLSFNYHPSKEGNRPPYNALIGYIVAAATLLVALGENPLDFAEKREELAECAHLLIIRDRLPFSVTDVDNTIRMLTGHRPITDWVSEEDVKSLRIELHEKSVRLLRSRKGLAWLREIISSPGGSARLLIQFSAPDERTLLRDRLRELQRKTPKASGAAC